MVAVVSIFGVAWSFLTLNGLSHLLLPALNLAFFKLALMTRLARAGTRETMLSDTAANLYIQDLADLVAMRQNLAGLEFYPIYVLDLSTISYEK